MSKYVAIIGDVAKVLFICIPLGLTIYIGLHVGFFFYTIYKKFK